MMKTQRALEMQKYSTAVECARKHFKLQTALAYSSDPDDVLWLIRFSSKVVGNTHWWSWLKWKTFSGDEYCRLHCRPLCKASTPSQKIGCLVRISAFGLERIPSSPEENTGKLMRKCSTTNKLCIIPQNKRTRETEMKESRNTITLKPVHYKSTTGDEAKLLDMNTWNMPKMYRTRIASAMWKY